MVDMSLNGLMGNMGGMATGFLGVLKWVLIVAIIGAIGYLFWMRKSYNIAVEFRAAGTSLIEHDKAKITTAKDGTKIMRFMRKRNGRVLTMPIPSFDIYFVGAKGKRYVKVMKKSEFEYNFIKPNQEFDNLSIGDSKTGHVNEKYIAVDTDWYNWLVQDLGRIGNKYAATDFLTKYGQMISIVLIGVIFIVGLYVISSNFTEAVEKFTSGISSICKQQTAVAPAPGVA